ncbi:MAG: hypothetical protein BWY11_00769 [Firmicutes bacterium ADurb.Bin182]|nr:MAG: hypothetical protein BWY11_00769 [Firmicutes bacterium ADurb.Bin182]
MKREIAVYLKIQAAISAAFNFFIGGMIASLIYHKADFVKTDALSIAFDLTITCLMTFAITTPFCRMSLRRDKTEGALAANSPQARLFVWLFNRPLLLCVTLGLGSALVLFVPAAAFFALISVKAVPFYFYVLLKSLFSAAFGAFATCTVLYAGMCSDDPPHEIT